MEKIDVAIIGAGPAGMTAGIYAVRKGLSARVFEKKIAGGNVVDSVLMENYPGIPSIRGFDLAQKMQAHFEGIGGKIEEGTGVKAAEKKNNFFEIELDSGEKIEAKSVIIASGTTHKKLKAKNAEKFEGKGIHYCATCDGPLYKGKTAAVIGGGNSGVMNALFLAEICKKVFLLEYGEALRADNVYEAQLKKAGVEIILNAEAFEITGKEKAEGLKYRERKTGKEKELKVDGIFVYVGLDPNSAIAKPLGCKTTARGFIDTSREMKTSIDGVFAAGDITGAFAQAIVAAGQGAIAAESAYEFVKRRKTSV
ncbi:MAG: FAD-dependent oxidoreductase [Candidatus Diapherotrites archaeon]